MTLVIAHLTIVRRNNGLFTIDGTASSMRGCVLMKLRVSSGRSLDVAYFSTVAEPAQQPGLEHRMENDDDTQRKLKDHANFGFLTATSARFVYKKN